MQVNRGKQFEGQIRKALQTAQNCSQDRFADPMAGYAGIRNICDFVAYRYPCQYYLECKTTNENTLPFSNITDNQWEGLLAKSKIYGVLAGYLIWFISPDRTVFISAQEMKRWKDEGKKSINIKDLSPLTLNFVNIYGHKKRVLIEYDGDGMVEDLYRYWGDSYNEKK